jgi:hypothetical protein
MDYSAARRIKSMKNPNEGIGIRTVDLRACKALPQPTAPLRTLNSNIVDLQSILATSSEHVCRKWGILMCHLKNNSVHIWLGELDIMWSNSTEQSSDGTTKIVQLLTFLTALTFTDVSKSFENVRILILFSTPLLGLKGFHSCDEIVYPNTPSNTVNLCTITDLQLKHSLCQYHLICVYDRIFRLSWSYILSLHNHIILIVSSGTVR